jgi:hypothetical protein
VSDCTPEDNRDTEAIRLFRVRADLRTLARTIDRYANRGRAVPDWMPRKIADLKTEIANLKAGRT